MSLPEVALDDVRFQELVNQCRARVAKQCHEWTEVNVSDPGITLIELFAWMTDMLCYRINRLPEKLHVALLSLLDVHLQPPRAAASDLRFELEGPPASPVRIPARTTEVATRRTPGQQSVVFQTTIDFTIAPAHPQACLLRRGQETIDVRISAGHALPAGDERYAFSRPPLPGDCILVGFRRPLDRLLVRVDVECERARGVGVNPLRPPLTWEASVPLDRAPDTSLPAQAWSQATVLGDSTDGFNKGKGSIELELPARTGSQQIGGHLLYWLRCSVVKSHSDPRYRPPEILSLTAVPVGATLPAEHCQRVQAESLGRSDGTPGQSFTLLHAPILPPIDGERLEVRDPKTGRWAQWQRTDTFADSEAHDRHYLLDETAGEIELGPTVRRADGTFRNYGAIPAPGSELRFSAYRHGGGSVGNVAAETLTHLRKPIPRVRSVTNPQAAGGGADGESLALAGERTAIELRTRHRAVTREDFERLCVVADSRVARARCVPAQAGQATHVHILPHVDAPVRRLSLRELAPDEQLLGQVARFLDVRRLVGTSIVVAPARFRAIRAVVHVVAGPATDVEDLQRCILQALYEYLHPLVGGAGTAAQGAAQGGWQFGRPLGKGELYPIVRAVDGVREVKLLRLFEEDLTKGETISGELLGDLELAQNEVIASGSHRVRVEVPRDVKVDSP